AQATAILNDNRDESVDIDWNEIDVGTPEDATAAKLANHHTAPWLEGERTSRHPRRDAVFAFTKLGIVGWILGFTLLGVIAAVLIILQIF
ncbi:MAG: hypothetical protein AAF235_08615, partial [Planctomycetota bacterium]